MPWWFWLMAAMWTVPLLIVVWMVVAIGRELLADRRLARGEADREARAEALCVRFVLTDEARDRPPNPIGAQRGNPRARP